MKTVIAVDPGGVTGLAVYSSVPRTWGPGVFELIAPGVGWAEIDCRDENDGVFKILNIIGYCNPDKVVIEDFILRSGTHTKDRSALAPVRVTAKLDFGMWSWSEEGDRRIDVVYQQPNERMLATDERIKRAGLWVKSDKKKGIVAKDARSAMQHLVVYLRKNGVDLLG